MKQKLLQILLRFCLLLDNWLYELISKLVVRIHGQHPKHEIIRYEQWFLNHITQDDTVVDVGSHDGAMCFVLATKAKKVTGIEIEKWKHEKAKNRNQFKNLDFILADATKTKIDQSFTVMTLSNVLEHIEDRTQFLKQILIQNTPKKVLIRVPLITREWLAIYKKNQGIDYRLDPTHYTEYTEDQLLSELISAGLSIESLEIRFGEAYVVCHT